MSSKACVKKDAEISKRGRNTAKTKAKAAEAAWEEREVQTARALETVITPCGKTVKDLVDAGNGGQVGVVDFIGEVCYKDQFAGDNSGSRLQVYAKQGPVWTKDERNTYLNATNDIIGYCEHALQLLPVPESKEDPVWKYIKPILDILNWMKNCTTSQKICLRALSGKKGCIIPASAWDNDIGLLNTPGGVLDIATGKIRGCLPGEFFRRQTGVEYIPREMLDLLPELWLYTLKEIFMPIGMPEEPEYEDLTKLEEKIRQLENSHDDFPFTFGDAENPDLAEARERLEEATARNAEKKRAYEEAVEAWRRGDIVDQVIEFFQRFCGYTLLGTNPEHKFAVLIGHLGRNGKGVVTRVLLNILGPAYGITTRSELFLKTRATSSGAPTPELMRLDGARLIVGSETDRGDKLNAALIKRFTGGDRMSGRGLHKDEVEFLPSGLLWLQTNFFPHFDSEDNAFLKRCIVIPFNRTFEDDPAEITPLVGKKDPDLEKKLMEEKEAIFAWCVEGARKYLEDGLKMPAVIAEAAETYRQNKDVIGCFLEECCDVEPGLEVPSSMLYGAYAQWSHDGQMKPSNRSMFKDRMTARGFQYVKNSSMFARGVCLNSVGEEMVKAYEYRNGHKRS